MLFNSEKGTEDMPAETWETMFADLKNIPHVIALVKL